jgi:hypothetical protein
VSQADRLDPGFGQSEVVCPPPSVSLKIAAAKH